MQGKVTLGLTTPVEFTAFNGKALHGKVDTGATTSSLHATNIQPLSNNQVRFVSPNLSANAVTLPLQGTQEVHTADAGGNERYVVALDVMVGGVSIRGTSFNLNDRSNMDSDVLIGENILSCGHFQIDPQESNDTVPEAVQALPDDNAIMEAISVLVANKVTLADIVTYLRTAAITSI